MSERITSLLTFAACAWCFSDAIYMAALAAVTRGSMDSQSPSSEVGRLIVGSMAWMLTGLILYQYHQARRPTRPG